MVFRGLSKVWLVFLVLPSGFNGLVFQAHLQNSQTTWPQGPSQLYPSTVHGKRASGKPNESPQNPTMRVLKVMYDLSCTRMSVIAKYNQQKSLVDLYNLSFLAGMMKSHHDSWI